jgi:hypothetical protein
MKTQSHFVRDYPINRLYKKLFPNVETCQDKEESPGGTSKIVDESPFQEFEYVLGQLVDQEIFSFDKVSVLNAGFNSARLTNGDHLTLPNTLDTLYADLIHSLDIATDKKEKIKAKVLELKNAKTNRLKLQRDQEVQVQESEYRSREHQLDHQLNKYSELKSLSEEEEKNIQSNEIPFLYQENQQHEEEIERLQVEFTQSRLKWYELGPAIGMGIILLAYLIIFYSSAAYILIYSEIDAKVAQMNGIPVVPAEVFDSMAIYKAVEKGGTALFFMLLFVTIPVGLALMKILVKRLTVVKHVIIWVFIFLVDALLAYVVAKSIHEVAYLSGKTEAEWSSSEFYLNEDFFLVFVLGALGLVIFKYVCEKIHHSFEERNGDAIRARNQVLIGKFKNRIHKIENERKAFVDKIDLLRKERISFEVAMVKLSKERAELPAGFERSKQHLFKKYSLEISGLEDVVYIWQCKLDNNDLSVSAHVLQDMVNTFIGGWINYLHDTYSRHKAIQMSSEAMLSKNNWLDGKVIN